MTDMLNDTDIAIDMIEDLELYPCAYICNKLKVWIERIRRAEVIGHANYLNNRLACLDKIIGDNKNDR